MSNEESERRRRLLNLELQQKQRGTASRPPASSRGAYGYVFGKLPPMYPKDDFRDDGDDLAADYWDHF